MKHSTNLVTALLGAAVCLIALVGCDSKSTDDAAAVRRMMEEQQAQRASEAAASKARFTEMKRKSAEDARALRAKK